MTSNSALLDLVDPDDEDVINSSQLGQSQDALIGIESDPDGDTDRLIDNENDGKKESPFSFAFYTKLFDVDTDLILSRLKWAVCPMPTTSSFAKKNIRAKPDLYGPFWVCVTLVFSIAISGNVASYFQYKIDPTSTSTHWHYDFHKVSLTSAIVFLYWTMVPTGVFAALWSGMPKDAPAKPSLMELICIFGYSMVPFVPTSLLWLVQISIVQWAFVLLSFLLSGGVLVLAIWPIVQEFSQGKTKGYTLIALILALHFILACGFMLCFFHVPNSTSATNPVAPMNATAEVTKPVASHEEKRETLADEPPTKAQNNVVSKNDPKSASNSVVKEVAAAATNHSKPLINRKE